MIRSMTGFGSAETRWENWMLRGEVRSVNHRDLQVSCRLPDMFQLKEYELQKLFSKEIRRGHVYFNLTCRAATAEAAVSVDQEAMGQYLQALEGLAGSAHVPFSVDLATLLRLPGTLRDATADEELKEKLWPHVTETAKACIVALVQMRRAEGANLSEQLESLCAAIEEETQAIEDVQGSFVEQYRDRLRERVSKLLAGTDVVVKEDSLAREVAIYADRCDVSEEIARLRSHVKQFREALAGDEEPVGRRMEFLGQEMLREAGTIAAKAPAGEHLPHVLELRSHIDKLREQTRNVE